MKKGIDVSVFQGNINWKNVKKSGIDFAIIRGGYGRYAVDEKFERNYKNAVENNVPVGVYHYSYADTVNKARQEAEFCLSYMKGKKFSYPVAFDVEDSVLSALSKKDLTDIVYAFCSEVEKNGYYVSIYSSKSWLVNKLDMKRLSRFDVWVAQWNSECTYKGSYGLWQYSNSGKIDGIDARVDLDNAYKDYPSIIKNAGLNGYGKDEKPHGGNQDNKKEYKKGDKITLKNAKIYSTAYSVKDSGRISGNYYIYDGERINGRYRITNSKRNVGRLPVSSYVTGWINENERN